MGIRKTVALVALSAGVMFAQNSPSFPGAFRFQRLTAGSLPNFTPKGMNDRGDTVGFYRDANNMIHGVLREANGGVTIVDVPGSVQTVLTAINNSGVATGIYHHPNSTGGSRAFVRKASGEIELKDVPGALSVELNGINSAGRMVGSYDGHGLIFEPDGTFNFFDVSPNVDLRGSRPGTTAHGITDAGEIVGSWGVYIGGGTTLGGCFVRSANGTLSYPPGCTGLLGVNNLGLQVAQQSFVGSPFGKYLRNSDDRRVYVAAPAPAGIDPQSAVVAVNNLNEIAGIDPEGKPFIGAPCNATITPPSQTVASTAGSVVVQVATDAGCTAGAGVPAGGFATLRTPLVAGNGSFLFEVSPNSFSVESRTGTLWVAGNAFTLTQSGAPCAPTFNRPGNSIEAAGGSLSEGVTAPQGCSWTATANVPWIQFTNAGGSGGGSVSFTVATNTSSTVRTGSIRLNDGSPYFVNQGGSTCAYAVTPVTASVPIGGGAVSIAVTATTGCPWTAASGAPWIALTSGSFGNGNGTTNFTVAGNNTGSARSAVVSVAGTSINVTQAGPTIAGLAFVPVTPCRLMDTRPAAGKSGSFGPPFLPAAATRDVPVPQGGCGIPQTARAYSLNVTVVPRGPLAYLTLYPSGQTRPNVSTLNAFEGQIIANAAIVPAGANGSVSMFVTNDTDVIIDVNGYFTDPSAPGSLVYYPLTPCRVIDTRFGSGGPGGSLGPPALAGGQARSFPVRSSNCGIPLSAGAYVFNVTLVPNQPLDYITAWPSGQPRLLVSVQNSPRARVLANAAIVPAGENGDISLYAPQSTDVVVDINGYFAPPGQPGGLLLYTVNPCRLADTRAGSGFAGASGQPLMAIQTSRLFPAAGACGVSPSAKALSLNLTVVPPGYLGFVTLYPGPQRPFVSTLNAWEGQVAANAALVPTDPSGGVNVYVSNDTHVILDVNGFFAP